jgi:hypothetical protein
MSDLFQEEVPDEYIEAAALIMRRFVTTGG